MTFKLIDMWPFNKKSFADVINPDQNQLLKALWEYKISSGVATPLDDNPTAYLKQGYSGNSDVYSIISRIIRMSGQARLALWTKDQTGKWKEVINHELCDFIYKVNPTMKTSDFMQGHLIYKLSIGNSYWYKPTLQVGVNKGKSKEIWLMPGNNVRILGGTSWMNPVGGYELETNTTVDFKPEEVSHSKFFNPLFGMEGSLYGQSPLKAAARIVAKQNQSETTELKQFENQGPPYLLYKDANDLMGSLTDEQVPQIEKIFKDYNKKYKIGQPIVLPDKFGILKLGVSPVDMNILNSSQEGRRILCSIYGMPSELFNDKAASTYNNMKEIKTDAWNNCLKPNLKDFADDLTDCLINGVDEYKRQGLFFEFDYSEIAELQNDFVAMVGWMKQANYTPNEMREATGAKPLDFEGMNEPWVGISDQPISQANAPLPDLIPAKDVNASKDYK